MKNTSSIHNWPASSTPSGFSILVHSRPAQVLVHLWNRLNDCVRPFLPLLYLIMVVTVIVVLGVVVFCNQHLPFWYDEVCMIDPAYNRSSSGVWHSIAQWDSINVIPFAPNYPLLINILRLPIAFWGVNYWILRGLMLVFGLVPVAVLLWFFRFSGLLRTWYEIMLALYFSACFTFFHWAAFLRPEPILLSVVALLVVAWGGNRPVLLFLSALLVPLCGLQWNALLVPAVLHWLIFGGRIRNPVLVGVAFVLSTVGTIVAYHFLGMWPSYLQEAARVGGGVDILHSAIARFRQLVCHGNARFIAWGIPPYDSAPVLLGIMGGIALLSWAEDWRRSLRYWLFATLSWGFIVLSFAFFGSLNPNYAKPLSLGMVFLFVMYRGTLRKRCPMLLCMVAMGALLFAARHGYSLMYMATSRAPTWRDESIKSLAQWTDERALRKMVESTLGKEDVVLCESSAYCEVRTCCKGVMPLCYAFDLSAKQQKEITAVLMADEPYLASIRDFSDWRGCSYESGLRAYIRNGTIPAPIDGTISPDKLLNAIGAHWQCTFAEIPLPPPSLPKAIRYRLFRPVWLEVPGNE